MGSQLVSPRSSGGLWGAFGVLRACFGVPVCSSIKFGGPPGIFGAHHAVLGVLGCFRGPNLLLPKLLVDLGVFWGATLVASEGFWGSWGVFGVPEHVLGCFGGSLCPPSLGGPLTPQIWGSRCFGIPQTPPKPPKPLKPTQNHLNPPKTPQKRLKPTQNSSKTPNFGAKSPPGLPLTMGP